MLLTGGLFERFNLDGIVYLERQGIESGAVRYSWHDSWLSGKGI